MGDSYAFGIIEKSMVVSGELASKIEKTFDWSDDPAHRIVTEHLFSAELDRAYYLYKLLDRKNWPPERIDPAYGTPACKDLFREEQFAPVSTEQIDGAIKTLRELDDKIGKMPFQPIKKPKNGPMFQSVLGVACLLKDELPEHAGFKYTEPAGSEYGIEHLKFKNVYFGRDKDDVNIVREVVKVYQWKYHHYGFPWYCTPGPDDFSGAKHLIRTLESAKNEYNALQDRQNQMLYLHWY